MVILFGNMLMLSILTARDIEVFIELPAESVTIILKKNDPLLLVLFVFVKVHEMILLEVEHN